MISIKKIVVIVICAVIVVLGIWGLKYLISIQQYQKIISNLKIDTIDLSNIHDGKYTGSFNTEYVGAEVSVVVKDKKITNITLLNHKNERGKPAEVILQNVVKAQSLQVDTVSGATNSSKVILKAIENALNSAK
ncbi:MULTISPECIES: FMN-binding protein [Clostridium]|uniref:FMN-binding protein n=1 Tax=Clostridium saccharoperbutylacetonicum N1-4(HMT) TaxID=931276 RepID=M1MK79_9CLOT|nr:MULTISPECIES: FMN-binding protein [Clostridium]AGF56698.1 FMN-binding protein [Clostridium saccharoperbutylacetonicum N1-4(HMT)]NRT62547.1 uncharacterized protein with FMN-binding domain [Clostridium saccharoperbutylacetonicum]NSB25894.1 uncharacterized protein with FMN-binding domain [Clostridium saccharoperbutylacetonicum]NSB45253.1 uncharacterized protein with FMN-binding domain [Clostridium saccharoperbutylacetonicum]